MTVARFCGDSDRTITLLLPKSAPLSPPLPPPDSPRVPQGAAVGPRLPLTARLAGNVRPVVVTAKLNQIYQGVVNASTEFIYVFSVANMSSVRLHSRWLVNEWTSEMFFFGVVVEGHGDC